MNQILESVFIALGAIWANKLRSFMTVLGNIVAVTSIVTVVTLIQGMNAMVSTAIISDVGADSFTIQRQPPIRSEEDEERTRNNPILTMDEADAIRAFSPLVTSVMGQTGRGGTVSYRDTELSQVTVQAVTSEYVNFSTFNAERGRLMSPTEVERGAAIAVIGWDTADRLFGQTEPLEKTIRVEGMPFRVVGVSEKKGSFFGNSQDSFVKLEEEILGELRRTFSPEFINRIDEVIVFNPLGEVELRSIVDILLDDVNVTLSERALRVEVSTDAKEWLLQKAGVEPSTGARPLRRTIQRHIQDPVSEILIHQHGESIGRIEVDLENGALSLVLLAPALPTESAVVSASAVTAIAAAHLRVFRADPPDGSRMTLTPRRRPVSFTLKCAEKHT